MVLVSGYVVSKISTTVCAWRMRTDVGNYREITASLSVLIETELLRPPIPYHVTREVFHFDMLSRGAMAGQRGCELSRSVR